MQQVMGGKMVAYSQFPEQNDTYARGVFGLIAWMQWSNMRDYAQASGLMAPCKQSGGLNIDPSRLEPARKRSRNGTHAARRWEQGSRAPPLRQ